MYQPLAVNVSGTADANGNANITIPVSSFPPAQVWGGNLFLQLVGSGATLTAVTIGGQPSGSAYGTLPMVGVYGAAGNLVQIQVTGLTVGSPITGQIQGFSAPSFDQLPAGLGAANPQATTLQVLGGAVGAPIAAAVNQVGALQSYPPGAPILVSAYQAMLVKVDTQTIRGGIWHSGFFADAAGAQVISQDQVFTYPVLQQVVAVAGPYFQGQLNLSGGGSARVSVIPLAYLPLQWQLPDPEAFGATVDHVLATFEAGAPYAPGTTRVTFDQVYAGNVRLTFFTTASSVDLEVVWLDPTGATVAHLWKQTGVGSVTVVLSLPASQCAVNIINGSGGNISPLGAVMMDAV